MWRLSLVISMLLYGLTGCNLDRNEGKTLHSEIVRDTFEIKLLQGFGNTDSKAEPIQDSLPSSMKPQIDSVKNPSQKNPIPGPVSPKNKSVQIKPMINKEIESTLFQPSQEFWSIPKTLDGARKLSEQHCPGARNYLQNSPDLAWKHVEFALSIYENGSLFYLKAQLYFNSKQYAEALGAAERSIALSDHWYKKDLLASFELKAHALKALADLYPSIETEQKANNAMNIYLLRKNEIRP